MQPGQVVAPNAPNTADDPMPPSPPVQPNPGGAPMPERSDEPDEAPLPTTAPGRPGAEPAAVYADAPQLPEADPAPPANPASPWQFNQDGGDPTGLDPDDPRVLPDSYTLLQDLAWVSPEFTHHTKGMAWYGAVIMAGVVAAALDYILTKDWFSTGAILFAIVALVAYSARKPRELQYALTREGLQIGTRMYGFEEFKNFSVTEDSGIASVVLMPLKRFMPALTVHVAPEIEDRVVDFFAAVLPFEEHRGDVIEGLMRRIRF